MRLNAAQRLRFCIMGSTYGDATLKIDTRPKILVETATTRK